MKDFAIDPGTIALFSLFMGLIMAFSMLYMLKARKTFPGFGLWTAASLIYLPGQILFAFQAFLPAWAGIVLANVLLVMCVQWMLRGMWRFGGREPSWALDLGVASFAAAGQALFSYLVPSLAARVAFFTGIDMVQAVFCLVAAFRFARKLETRMNGGLATGLGMLLLIGAARLGFSLAHGAGAPRFAMQSSLQAAWLMLYSGSYVLIFLGLQNQNAQRVEEELRRSMEEVKTLSGIIPICSNCKKVRNDKGYWEQVEAYVARHSEAGFSHGICPECAQKLYPEAVARINAKKGLAEPRDPSAG